MPRHLIGILAMVITLTGLYVCWTGACLIWDGAYQLAISLWLDRPFVYEGRFHTFFLWRPAVWLARVTEKPLPIQVAYGMPFMLAPVAGLLGSWWIVRRHRPELILWAIFGIAAAPLPGQIFVINDSIFQQHLFWPLFLALFVPIDWRQGVMIAALAIFQFAHPIGMALFVGAAACALTAAWLDPRRVRRHLIAACVCILLATLVLLRLKMVPDSYAQREFSWANARERWMNGVAGAPITGLLFVYAAAVLLLVKRRGWSRASDALSIAALVCLGIAAFVWIRWASDVTRWHLALDYRRWLVPLAAPFYAFAALEAVLPRPAANPPEFHAEPSAAVLLVSLFAMVLCLQSRGWAGLQARLMSELEQSPFPIRSVSSFSWIEPTPLRHWGITTLSFFLQGRQPRKAVMSDLGMQLMCGSPPKIAYADDDIKDPHPGPAGWFDLRPLTAAARRPAPAARPVQTSPSAPPSGAAAYQKSPGN